MSILPVNLSVSFLPVDLFMSTSSADLPSTYTLSVDLLMSSLLDLFIHIST